MVKKFSTRIFLVLLTIVVSLTTLIVYFSYQTIQENFYESLIEELSNHNKILEPIAKERIENNEISKLRQLVNSYSSSINARITIMDDQGFVLAESRDDSEKMDNHSNRPEVKSAILGETKVAERYSRTLNETMIYVAMPIKSGDITIGVIRSSFFNSKFKNLMVDLLSEMVGISALVIFFALLVILLFSRNITRPLNQLSLAASRVASGDFNIKVKLRGKDEVAELSQSFNNMTKRIKKLFDKVTSQKEELDALIYTIQEGLVLIRKNGQIVLFNEAFKKIVGKTNISGYDFEKVMDSPEILRMLKDTKKKQKALYKEIRLGNNYYLVSTNILSTKDEVVLLFHNITEIKQFEEIKKDFVVNVSHELRTPLTAIKGFVETMEEDLPEDEKYYLSIISRHTDRLIRIVNDLLTLSELEEISSKLDFSRVDMKDMFDYIIKLFEFKLKEKNLDIEFSADEELPLVELDRYRIEQVIINLLENAIKYTDKGGIRIRLSSSLSHINFEIADSGIGIPKEDQSRIFERFYIVDKSRSRKVGGTGLGLSIVKHIVNSHQGQIFLESEKEIGTKFSVTLPIDQTS
jgi:two-component system phosphate regulon sensor histidine kinase PhoR